MFDQNLIARQVTINYFDIPELHQFTEEGHKFFEELARIPSDNLEMFDVEIIQILITHKWMMMSDYIMYMLFGPYLLLLTVNLLWHINIRTERQNYYYTNYGIGIVLFCEVMYFLIIECLQAVNSPSEYFSDPTNFFNILPLYTVL